MNGPLPSHDCIVHHNEEKPFDFRCYHLGIFLSPAALIVLLGIVFCALIVLYLWAHCGLVAQPCTILANSLLAYCTVVAHCCLSITPSTTLHYASVCCCASSLSLCSSIIQQGLLLPVDSLSNSTNTRTKLQCCYVVWTTVYGVIGLQCCQLVVALCLCTELLTASFFTLLACIPAMHSWRCLCTIS